MTSQCIKMNRNKLIEWNINAEHHLCVRQLITLRSIFIRTIIDQSLGSEYFFGNWVFKFFGKGAFAACQNWSILDSSRCGKPSMHISLIRYRSFETYVKGWKVLNDFSKLHLCLISESIIWNWPWQKIRCFINNNIGNFCCRDG